MQDTLWVKKNGLKAFFIFVCQNRGAHKLDNIYIQMGFCVSFAVRIYNWKLFKLKINF